MKAPQPQKIEKVFKEHGETRTDNYYWLRERENPKVIEYLEAENTYLKEELKHTDSLQNKLFDEMVSRIQPNSSSVPYEDNKFFYYERFEEGQEYPFICRKAKLDSNEETVLLNVNLLAEGNPFYELGEYSISPDNKILAFSADNTGRRFYQIYFKNIETGEIYQETISKTDGSVIWAADSKTVFFVNKDEETLREYQVFRLEAGKAESTKILVFEEEDDEFYIEIDKTKSEKYITIECLSTVSTETLILDANNPEGKFKVFQSREEDLEYAIEHHKECFYVLSNLNEQNFQLFKTPSLRMSKENWKPVFTQYPDVFIEDFDVFEDFIVLKERKDALIQVRIVNLKTKKEHYLDFGEDAYETWISENYEFNSSVFRYGYSSMTTPTSYFDYNMNTHKSTLLKQQKVEGSFSSVNYETKRLYVDVSGGQKIPISIVYKKGIALDGENPMLVYAYGSYGISSDVYFSSSRLSLLDRGFVYAIAHVRGGQERGRNWYDDGKLLHKKNTFTDFVACTKFLHEKGYSNPRKTFAEGGSAGGLLVGVVANMEPELFTGIVADVPFVDVVTTMLDDTIPLTSGEYNEWGNPHKKEFYEYMKSYSPYDCISEQSYPSMLITAGFHDSQVQYWEPAKWAAKLREANLGKNRIYLHTNMETGHGGASGRFEPYRDVALAFAFMLDRL